MPTAPAADQVALLHVQEIDTKVQQAQHRRANLPALERLEALAASAAELETQVGALSAEVSDIKREVTKAEDDVKAVRDRAARDTQRMEAGGLVSKELLAIQSELDLLANRQTALEDIELEAMERLEGAEKQLAEAAAALEQVAADTQVAAAERDTEFAKIAEEIGALEAERAEAVAALDDGLIALYEKLRASHGGVGAAPLSGGACQGCHMSLNPVDLKAIEGAGADVVTRCEECGRILVRQAA